MKNDLTTEEWLALDEYLRFGKDIIHFWKNNGFWYKSQTLKSAKKKINQVAKQIRQRG